MMTQMLQITTKPIQYKLEIERGRLEYDQDYIPKGRQKSKPADLEVKTKNGSFLIDTYQARKSLGYSNIKDRTQQAADKGMESIGKTKRAYVEIGYDMTRINEGVTIADIFAKKFLGEQPMLYTAFLPSTGAELSWVPHEIDSNFEDPELSFDWEKARNVMNYVPGSVRMTILEWPSISIEYIGGRIYFPPKANPDYAGDD